MKLITIGNSQNATVKLNSTFVSSNHAEIILIDNGDIILIDKGSKNGTYVQNQKIEPNKEVVIRRGDSVRFADVYLDWSTIPTIPPIDYGKIKGIYGIGSNPRNQYRLYGNTVSRFHATLTETKSGKWFIRDHSTNGTTINGKKLSPEVDYPINPKDVIVCGGVNLDNPIPKGSGSFWKYAVSTVAVMFVIIGVIFGIKLFSNKDIEEISTASALVYGEYYYVVELEDDPFVDLLPGWPTKYYVGLDDDGSLMLSFDKNEVNSFSYSGTAFFISDDGKMVTNRHVACPWYKIDDELRRWISQQMTVLRNEIIETNQFDVKLDSDHEKLLNTSIGEILYDYMLQYNKTKDLYRIISDVNAYIMRYKGSRINIKGEQSYIGIAVAGRKYNSFLELEPCTVLKLSDNPDTDIAIMQLNAGLLPATVKYKYDLDKCIMDQKNLKVQKESYYILGYPSGFELNLDNLDRGLTPKVYGGKISRIPGEFTFELQGEAIGGSSGSPICTKRGKLAGVLYAKSTHLTTGSFGIHAKYAKEMNDKIY